MSEYYCKTDRTCRKDENPNVNNSKKEVFNYLFKLPNMINIIDFSSKSYGKNNRYNTLFDN
jgi:hypothetical protein